jgi:hypothetical protein
MLALDSLNEDPVDTGPVDAATPELGWPLVVRLEDNSQTHAHVDRYFIAKAGRNREHRQIGQVIEASGGAHVRKTPPKQCSALGPVSLIHRFPAQAYDSESLRPEGDFHDVGRTTI